MSTDINTLPKDLKILHAWNVTIDREVDETNTESVNGQMLPVTRKVTKPISTRMGLRALTRKEARAADLFRAARTAHYVKDHGLLLAHELTNRLINTTGGVLSDKQTERVEQLRERHATLDADLARSIHEPEDVRARLTKELATVRAELINLNAINESLYSQTAEAKAEADLNNWVTFHVIVIDRGGPATPRWEAYFEGASFDAREEHMWKLDESKDEFYSAAVPKIATYVYWYNKGADSAEQFKLMDDELARQVEARKQADLAADAALAATPAAADVPEPATTVPATEPASTP